MFATPSTNLELNGDGVYTYGHRLEAARKFFGATTIVKPDQELGPGNPRRPEHPIVVRAEMRVLFDTLKHELELDHLPSGLKKPIDAIWTGFDVEESFFRQEEGTSTFTREQKREFLAALINAHEIPDIEARTAEERVVLERIPAGWTFVQRAWTIVTEFAFLEFYLIYAFNDYKEYGTWPFDNEHEGDVEGCCVVFRRSALEDFAAGRKTAAEVIPHTVITSAHEEFNDADELKRLPEDPDRARVQLRVFVAPGSHATYITPGPHDILDFEDIATDLPGELPTGFLIALVGGGRSNLLVAAILFAGLVEKLVDSEDETSNDGVSIGPGPADEPNLKFDKRIEVTPLSDFQKTDRTSTRGSCVPCWPCVASRANGAAMTASSTRARRGRTRRTASSGSSFGAARSTTRFCKESDAGVASSPEVLPGDAGRR